MKRLTLLLILPPVFGCEIENNVYNLDKSNPNHFLEEEVCEPAEPAVEGDKQPVAVCSASTLATSPISGSVDFFGHESHDPNGYPIVHYRWAIVDKPEGSEADLGAGIAGESIDDPSLDLDDIDNVGPENINIEEPANGLYTVVVHDFPSSVYEGSNKVTVRIHLDGEVVFEKTKNISGEDSYVPFALIEWPSKLVQGL